MSEPLWRWDATALAGAIRKREVSSREAVVSVLDRLDQVNPAINAVVVVRREEALREADHADQAARGGGALGPLHGVPVTIKDNVDQVGYATVNGVAANRELIATEDSPPVRSWKRAGAIIVGRTNTPAYSLRWHTENDVWGRTYNPWARDRTPGGSSGGAAAAVATGIGPLAHGSDLGGSVRYPAYCCGVAGIRPTLGRLASYNGTATVERPITGQLMAVQGVLARRVADVRLGYHAMSAGDPRDPWWVPVPVDLPPPSSPPRGAPIKVALCPDPAGMAVDPQVADAVRQAGEALAGADYQVELAEPPGIERMFEVWAQTVTMDLRSTMGALIEQHADQHARTAIGLWFELFPPVDVDSYIRLVAERSKHLRDWILFLERYPIVVGPNSGQPPFEIGFDCDNLDASRQLMRAQRLMAVVNGLGLPSVAVPVGTYQRGPLGVQVIAGRYREEVALAAAERIESAQPVPTPIDPR